MSGSELSYTSPNGLAVALGRCSALRTVILSNLGINPAAAGSFSQALIGCTQLTTLDISVNNVGPVSISLLVRH